MAARRWTRTRSGCVLEGLVLAPGASPGLEDPAAEIALRRLARAEELGISYRAYTLEILERGRYL